MQIDNHQPVNRTSLTNTGC